MRRFKPALSMVALMLAALLLLAPLPAAPVVIAGGEEEVTFNDLTLEDRVRGAIGKLEGPIYPSDLEGFDTLWAAWFDIADLTGLEYCVDLTHAYLAGNQITDISPLSGLTSLTEVELGYNEISNIEPLVNLTSLQRLDLSGNQIDDIGPLADLTSLQSLLLFNNQIDNVGAIEGLTSLELLSLGRNQIDDLGALYGLTSLTSLNVSNNQVHDIGPLSGLINLELLDLGGNQVENIGPLEDLISLESLFLGHNLIEDIVPLEGLTMLKALRLGSNQIADIGPVSGLINLTELYLDGNEISSIELLTGLANLITLNLMNNNIEDIGPLSGLTSLTELYLHDNVISDLGPLAGLSNLKWLRLGSNQIEDIGPLSGLTSLTELYLEDNQIADIEPLQGLTGLDWLNLEDNQIVDLEPLAALVDLTWLNLGLNQIADIGPISGLTKLGYLDLRGNAISDIEPLVDNPGFGEGDVISLHGNALSETSLTVWIPQLEGRGVTVWGYFSIDTTELPDGQVGLPYGQYLWASDGVHPYTWEITDGALPDGLSLEPETGYVSGTPSEAGEFTFTVQVTDDTGISLSRELSIIVTELVIDTTELPDSQMDVEYTAQLEASGGSEPHTWAVTDGDLPYGLTLATDTGLISGTPTTRGTWEFTVQVTDNAGITATSDLSVSVTVLAIDTIDLPAGHVFVEYEATLEASGGSEPYTWELTDGDLPDGLSLATATGTVSGTPTATGTWEFTMQVTDDAGMTATSDLSIDVTEAYYVNAGTVEDGTVASYDPASKVLVTGAGVTAGYDSGDAIEFLTGDAVGHVAVIDAISYAGDVATITLTAGNDGIAAGDTFNLVGLPPTSDDPFRFIQSAVNMASPGDSIMVKAGTYNERIFVHNKSGLTIESVDGPLVTIIDGAGLSGPPVILFLADGTTFKGFTVQNAVPEVNGDDGAPGFGIGIVESSDCVVKNNIFKHNEMGIALREASNCSVIDNTVTANDDNGIVLMESSGTAITGNTVTDNGENGIVLMHSSGNTIDDNTFVNNAGDGVFLFDSSENTIAGNNVSGNAENGLTVVGSSANTIEDNIFYMNGDAGIELIGGIIRFMSEEAFVTENNTIMGNSIGHNGSDGISLINSSGNTIEDNSISNNGLLATPPGSGISITGGKLHWDGSSWMLEGASENNAVQGNEVYGHTAGSGVSLLNASNTLIHDNHVHDNGNGVMVMGINDPEGTLGPWPAREGEAVGNIVSSNLIEENSQAGIAVGFVGSDGCDIAVVNNTISGNDSGVTVSECSAADVITINYNRISGNGAGVTHDGDGTIDATHNWWGHATGPDHADNPHGTEQGGDTITGEVCFSPWYATGTTTPETRNVTVKHEGYVIAYSDTIQGGVDAALAGSAIMVEAGTYNEQVVIDGKTGLIIESAHGADDTVIDGTGLAGPPVIILAAGTTFSGFTVQNAVGEAGGDDPLPGFGIGVDGAADCVIENNIVKDNEMGIALRNASGCAIVNNTVTGNYGNGIMLMESSGIDIVDNEITHNENGIALLGSSDISVKGNEISFNDVNGIALLGSSDNSIADNTIAHNSDAGIRLMGGIIQYFGEDEFVTNNNVITGNEVHHNSRGGISLMNSSGNTIESNTIYENGLLASSPEGSGISITGGKSDWNPDMGVWMMEGVSENNVVRANEIYGHTGECWGMFIANASNTLIEDNHVHDNEFGVALMGMDLEEGIPGGPPPMEGEATGNIISGNRIEANSDMGLAIGFLGSEEEWNVAIEDNELLDNGTGLYVFFLAAHDSVSITANVISGSTDYGVHIEEDASVAGITMNHNVISGNDYGVKNDGDGTLDATLNWWGHHSGPGDEGPGSGDSVSINVDYDPWTGVDRIEIAPVDGNVTAGGTIAYTATAFDEFDNELGDVTGETTFTISDGAAGSWDDNVYTAEKAGNWTVTADFAGLADSAGLTVAPGQVAGIVIAPVDEEVTTGEDVAYTVTGFDEFGNEVGEVTAETMFSISEGAAGSWDENVYTSATAGTWTVTAQHREVTETTGLTVTIAEAASIVIIPANENVKAGEKVTYTVTAFDGLGNEIGDVTAEVTFSISEGAAGSWDNNVYTADKAGEWTVTAVYGEIAASTSLTVDREGNGFLDCNCNGNAEGSTRGLLLGWGITGLIVLAGPSLLRKASRRIL